MARKSTFLSLLSALLICCGCAVNVQKQALDSITIDELCTHMNFIAADETLGRDTPSQELKITCRYLATLAQSYGLKPLMPDGSYYQQIPLHFAKISETNSQIILTTPTGKQVFQFPQAFDPSGRSNIEGSVSGSVVFIGLGLNAPDQGWDDFGDLDLTDKIVVMLDARLPEDQQTKFRQSLRGRAAAAQRQGAAAVLTVVNPRLEIDYAQNNTSFTNTERMERDWDDYFPPSSTQTLQTQPILQARIRHDLGAAILGVSPDRLNEMFDTLARGEQVPAQEFPDKNIDITIQLSRRTVNTQNVIAYIEGRDPQLKDEYIVIGSHPDHLGVRNGQVMNGADDNVSGVIAMLEIAQALLIDRPRRSVILAWFTGEEKGLMGSHFFADQCPVSIENVSAMLNLDMICRNDTDHLYLVASNLLSSQLDASINEMNDEFTHFKLDYEYQDPNHPDRFYRRSDHYPFNLFGVPAVWFFCGTTEDYHRPTDTIEKVDYQKMKKVTQLTFLVCRDIGNRDQMLKLDANPKITTRGRHNLATQLNR